jgi:hypothetical protein
MYSLTTSVKDELQLILVHSAIILKTKVKDYNLKLKVKGVKLLHLNLQVDLKEIN